jgi:thiosulfate/3-mercaptopyruvate sulfurtransferase
VVEVDVSRRAHDEWHIAGAVLWNVYADLKDADYQLTDAAAAQQLFARSGIRPDSTVVFYGYAPAMGFWLMKLYGHADVRILDCSRDTWQREDRPRSTTAAEPAATRYTVGGQDGRLRAGHAAVRDGIADPGVVLLDVRTQAWNQAAARAASPPRSTSPLMICTTTAEPSGPAPICAGSSRRPIPPIPAATAS